MKKDWFVTTFEWSTAITLVVLTGLLVGLSVVAVRAALASPPQDRDMNQKPLTQSELKELRAIIKERHETKEYEKNLTASIEKYLKDGMLPGVKP